MEIQQEELAQKKGKKAAAAAAAAAAPASIFATEPTSKVRAGGEAGIGV